MTVYEQIVKELFVGKDAALTKYAKVRATCYEIYDLWYRYNLPLDEVDASAKRYFQMRFLNGDRISAVDEDTLLRAFERLKFAAGRAKEPSGCRLRCTKLVERLNECLSGLGLETVKDIDSFLDWLTFDHYNPEGNDEEYIDPQYRYPVWLFNDSQNRKEFWSELKHIIDSDLLMSMQDVCKIVLFKRRRAKSIPRG